MRHTIVVEVPDNANQVVAGLSLKQAIERERWLNVETKIWTPAKVVEYHREDLTISDVTDALAEPELDGVGLPPEGEQVIANTAAPAAGRLVVPDKLGAREEFLSRWKGTLWEGGARYWRGRVMYRPVWAIEDVELKRVRPPGARAGALRPPDRRQARRQQLGVTATRRAGSAGAVLLLRLGRLEWAGAPPPARRPARSQRRRMKPVFPFSSVGALTITVALALQV